MANANKKGQQSSLQPPNQTLYISNLPDRLRKQDLHTALYCLFSTYGSVLDIVALKTAKMRGQAHVAFRDVQSSSQALRALQGFEFFGKQMRIDYARGKTNSIAMLDGSFQLPTPARSAPDTAQTSLQQSVFGGVPSDPVGALAAPASTAAVPSPQGMKRPREDDSEEDDDDDDDAPMDEDEDSDAPMEEDSSSDSERD